VAVVSWVIASGFGTVGEDDADTIDRVSKISLPILYALFTLVAFVPPIVRARHYEHRPEKPYDEYSLKPFSGEGQLDFYPFVKGKNVFFS
jgi:hypothetical protein